jgi:hypothetical protein
MSDERLQHLLFNSCKRKRKLSEKEANDAVDYYTERNEVMYFYKCSFCNKFHLTHSPPIKQLDDEILNRLIQKANTMDIPNRRKRPCKRRR